MNEDLVDMVEIEDVRTQNGELPFKEYLPLRTFRGNYGVPRKVDQTVVKGFFVADDKTITRLVQLQEAYHNELRLSLTTVPTEINRDGNLFYLTQSFIGGVNYEQFLQSDAPPKAKRAIYEQLLYDSLNFISKSDKIVGLDAKPENWMQTQEGQWAYIDTFPPFLLDDENIFGDIFTLRDFEKDFVRTPENSFFRNKRKIARRFWMKSEKFYSEMDYLSATIQVIKCFDQETSRFFERFMEKYK